MKNKNIAISLIALISLLVISLIIIICIDINNSPSLVKYMFSKGNSDKLAITETYEKNFDVIKIDSTGCDINIKHIDSDEFIVNVYGDKDYVEVKSSDSELSIEINKDNFINEDLYKIVVYLPFSYDRYVFINNDYGDINISNFSDTNFEIDLDYGNIYVDEANRLDIKNKIGDIHIVNSKYIDVDSNISRVDIDEVNEVVINNKIGNIKIKKINNYIDIDNKYGDINLSDVSLDRDSKLRSDIGDINIDYTSNIKISSDTFIGRVINDKKANKGDYKFSVNNKVGDIKIKHS